MKDFESLGSELFAKVDMDAAGAKEATPSFIHYSNQNCQYADIVELPGLNANIAEPSQTGRNGTDNNPDTKRKSNSRKKNEKLYPVNVCIAKAQRTLLPLADISQAQLEEFLGRGIPMDATVKDGQLLPRSMFVDAKIPYLPSIQQKQQQQRYQQQQQEQQCGQRHQQQQQQHSSRQRHPSLYQQHPQQKQLIDQRQLQTEQQQYSSRQQQQTHHHIQQQPQQQNREMQQHQLQKQSLQHYDQKKPYEQQQQRYVRQYDLQQSRQSQGTLYQRQQVQQGLTLTDTNASKDKCLHQKSAVAEMSSLQQPQMVPCQQTSNPTPLFFLSKDESSKRSRRLKSFPTSRSSHYTGLDTEQELTAPTSQSIRQSHDCVPVQMPPNNDNIKKYAQGIFPSNLSEHETPLGVINKTQNTLVSPHTWPATSYHPPDSERTSYSMNSQVPAMTFRPGSDPQQLDYQIQPGLSADSINASRSSLQSSDNILIDLIECTSDAMLKYQFNISSPCCERSADSIVQIDGAQRDVTQKRKHQQTVLPALFPSNSSTVCEAERQNGKKRKGMEIDLSSDDDLPDLGQTENGIDFFDMLSSEEQFSLFSKPMSC